METGEFGSPAEALREAVRVWQRQRQDQADRLDAIRARIRRSLDDPRPSLSEEEAQAEMNRFMDAREEAFRDAAS